MPFVLIAALKDLRRRIADPAALVLWLGVPMVLGGLMTVAVGGNGAPPKAHVLLVDEDRSAVGTLLVAAARQGQIAQFLEIEPVGAEEGRARIDAGGASALLVLPNGFGAAVLREEPAELTLITNPAQRILPLIIEEGLNVTVEAEFYAQRLFGEPLRELASVLTAPGAPSSDQVASLSRLFNDRLQSLQGTLVPPILSLEVTNDDARAATLDFKVLLLPSMLFMSLLFIAQGLSQDIWIERERGTLRRMMCTPQPIARFLGGKLAAGAAITSMVALIAVAIAVSLYHAPIARAPLALLWAAYAGAALICYFLFLQVVSSSARGGGFLTSLIVFPLMMIGGSFFPFEMLPGWMAAVGKWTPNGLAVVQLKALLFGTIDRGALLVASVGLGGPAAVAFLLTVRRLSRFGLS